MIIQYLGTGGGAGIPEIFCNCRICKNARKSREKDIRYRPLAIINHELCIDFPCDVRENILRHNINSGEIHWILITHNHYDHFFQEGFLSRPEGACQIELYISKGSGETFANRCEKIREKAPIINLRPVNIPNIHFVEAFQPIRLGSYSVIPIKANHENSIEPLNYILSHESKTILWLHDTGPLLNETKKFLEENKYSFDFVSLDCSLPEGGTFDDGHMDITRCQETAHYLQDIGCLKDTTTICLSHIGHLVNKTHAELCEEASKYGFDVAYDGKQFEI